MISGSLSYRDFRETGPWFVLHGLRLVPFLYHRIPGLYIYSRCFPGVFSQYVFSKENSHKVTVPFLGKRRYLDTLRVKGAEVGKQFLRMGYFLLQFRFLRGKLEVRGIRVLFVKPLLNLKMVYLSILNSNFLRFAVLAEQTYCLSASLFLYVKVIIV